MSSPRSQSPRRRSVQAGFTLVELLIASAMGMIIVVAAFATFDLQRRIQVSSDRLLSVYSAMGLGLAPLQRNGESAGFRFPSTQFAVQVVNNVSGSQLPPGPDGANPVPISATNVLGVVPGTDVIEVWRSDGDREPSAIQSPPVFLGSGVVRVELDSTGTYPNPLKPAELAALAGVTQGPVLLFRNAAAECIGLVTDGIDNAGRPTLTVQISFGDLTANTGAPTTCPAMSMKVYALTDRRRYFIQQQNNGARYGLYEQRSASPQPTNWQGGVGMGVPEVVALGLEDLQAAMVLDNTSNAVGCGATATCTCWEVAGDCNPLSTANIPRLRGLRVSTVARGVETFYRSGDKRPALYDHVGATAADNLARSVMEVPIPFPNFDPSTTSAP